MSGFGFDDINELVDMILKPDPLPRDVADALEIADSILMLVDDLPEEGEDFGLSVAEKAESIAANIRKHRRVTDGQLNALENMLAGVERWFD